MACTFSFAHLQNCLDRSMGRAIEIIHDIDFPPNNVLQIAAMESQRGLRAKYFVRLHSPLYNAVSWNNLQIFRSLVVDHHHEIGLHFEPQFYDAALLTSAIEQEASLLGTLVGAPVRYVSAHSPLKAGRLEAQTVPPSFRFYGFDAPYYQGKKYISDSGGRWREGCWCSHIGKHNELIVLTHPSWWFETTPSENY